MLTSIDVKFIFDSVHLCLSSSANILQMADVALWVVFLLFLPVFVLYCAVTFFDGCVWRITSELRGEPKPTILEQSDCASSLVLSCESLDWSFESFASLRHRFRLVESRPERTKLRTRANSISFPPRPILASCLSCNRTGEVFSYPAIQTMFVFAEVYLALPFGWKCLYI